MSEAFRAVQGAVLVGGAVRRGCAALRRLRCRIDLLMDVSPNLWAARPLVLTLLPVGQLRTSQS